MTVNARKILTDLHGHIIFDVGTLWRKAKRTI